MPASDFRTPPRFSLALVFLALAGACSSGPAGVVAQRDGGGDGLIELPAPAHVNATRPAAVYVPAAYDARTPLPVVILLGGYDYRAADFDDWVHVRNLVDELRFILVMPDGLIDSAGSNYWNATDTCCDYDGTDPDDVGYIKSLIGEITTRFSADPGRIGIIGHSNGAFMGYRMACEDAGVAALVSIAGATFQRESLCHATGPLSVLQVHGSADDTMPFAGDDEAPGALDTLRRWAVRAECNLDGGLVENATKREYAADQRSDETTVSRYEGCRAPYDVELWKLTGADHYPPFRATFTRDALLWLFAHRR